MGKLFLSKSGLHCGALRLSYFGTMQNSQNPMVSLSRIYTEHKTIKNIFFLKFQNMISTTLYKTPVQRYYLYRAKTSGAWFFNTPIGLIPTTNTLISNCPARFLFLTLIAKCLDEILTDAGVSIWSPKHWPDRTVVMTVLCLCMLLICHHFFCSLVYINVYHFTTIKI